MEKSIFYDAEKILINENIEFINTDEIDVNLKRRATEVRDYENCGWWCDDVTTFYGEWYGKATFILNNVSNIYSIDSIDIIRNNRKYMLRNINIDNITNIKNAVKVEITICEDKFDLDKIKKDNQNKEDNRSEIESIDYNISVEEKIKNLFD